MIRVKRFKIKTVKSSIWKTMKNNEENSIIIDNTYYISITNNDLLDYIID